MYVEDVVAADGDNRVEFAGGVVVSVGEAIDRLAELHFQLSLQARVCILSRASAYHEQEAGPLQTKWLGGEAGHPPLAIFLQKGRRVNNIVMIINAGEEVLH